MSSLLGSPRGGGAPVCPDCHEYMGQGEEDTGGSPAAARLWGRVFPVTTPSVFQRGEGGSIPEPGHYLPRAILFFILI